MSEQCPECAKLRERIRSIELHSGSLYNWIQDNVTIDERTRDVMNKLFQELDKGVKERFKQ